MKKLIAVLMVVTMASQLSFATTFNGTCFPAGLSTSTNRDTTDTADTTALASGDIFCAGELEVAGTSLFTGAQTFTGASTLASLWIPTQNKVYFTTDASFNGLRLAYEQTTSSVTSGTMRGMELRVSTQKDCGGSIRGAEIKAVQQNITGQSTVALLNGLYANADGKDNIATIMRGLEVSLDQEAGGTCTEAVGAELMNNSSGSMTKAYGLSLNGGTASGHKAYDADIRFQNGLQMTNDATTTLKVTDGTNTLLTVTDAGTTGNLAVTGTLGVTGASTLAATGVSGTLTTTGAGGIANTYGITSATAAFTNSTYGVSVASATTSTAKLYLGGAFAALPTTGFSAGSIIYNSADTFVYVATETVTGAYSWIKIGAQ